MCLIRSSILFRNYTWNVFYHEFSSSQLPLNIPIQFYTCYSKVEHITWELVKMQNSGPYPRPTE